MANGHTEKSETEKPIQGISTRFFLCFLGVQCIEGTFRHKTIMPSTRVFSPQMHWSWDLAGLEIVMRHCLSPQCMGWGTVMGWLLSKRDVRWLTQTKAWQHQPGENKTWSQRSSLSDKLKRVKIVWEKFGENMGTAWLAWPLLDYKSP